jgi:hypothetical protein
VRAVHAGAVVRKRVRAVREVPRRHRHPAGLRSAGLSARRGALRRAVPDGVSCREVLLLRVLRAEPVRVSVDADERNDAADRAGRAAARRRAPVCACAAASATTGGRSNRRSPKASSKSQIPALART